MISTEASQPKPVNATRVLVGEGVEEVLFFEALLAHLQIPCIQVEECRGKAGLAPYLKALKNRSGFSRVEKLGIVRDADEDSVAADSSVESALSQASFSASLIVKKLILPGKAQIGALENLCLLTMKGQPIETCIEDYLLCAAGATGSSHTTTTNKAKARIHAWLAAQQQPDLRLGHAARKGLLNWDSPAFEELKEFLRGLA